MTYKLNAQHVASVSRLPGPERYQYFVKRVADWEQGFAIQGEQGLFTAADDNGVIYLPLWSHPLFAEMCITGEWSGANVTSIHLDELLDSVLPRLEREKQMVSVMPRADGTGVPVDPRRLRADLLSELGKIE